MGPDTTTTRVTLVITGPVGPEVPEICEDPDYTRPRGIPRRLALRDGREVPPVHKVVARDLSDVVLGPGLVQIDIGVPLPDGTVPVSLEWMDEAYAPLFGFVAGGVL